MPSLKKKLIPSIRLPYQKMLIDWKRILIDEEYAVNFIQDYNLIAKQKCDRSGCQKNRKLSIVNGQVIMRCPNYNCFRQEKDNKSWVKPKLYNFEHCNLHIGEILYIIIWAGTGFTFTGLSTFLPVLLEKSNQGFSNDFIYEIMMYQQLCII